MNGPCSIAMLNYQRVLRVEWDHCVNQSTISMGHFPVRKLLNYSVGLMIYYITDQLQALFDPMEKNNN